MAKQSFIKITPSPRYLLLSPCNTETLIIVRTGSSDLFFVIKDNAFQDEDFGKCEVMSAEMIFKKYNIDVESLYPKTLDYNKWSFQERNREKPDID